ncbi:hypothetical protein MAH1_05940 [Sessilibacter sp. MAH1]
MEFKKVIAGAFYFVDEYKRVLLRALALPFLAYVLLGVTQYMAVTGVLAVVVEVVRLAILAVFAITTHRIILLGPNSVSRWGITAWTKRETFFFLHAVGIVLMGIPMVLLNFIPILGSLASLIIICWFAGRFCLVFPGIAVDKGVSFKLSWELTKSHQVLMFLVVIVFPTVLAIPTYILSFVPYSALLSSAISAFLFVYEVAALSVAYQLITAERYKNNE